MKRQGGQETSRLPNTAKNTPFKRDSKELRNLSQIGGNGARGHSSKKIRPSGGTQKKKEGNGTCDSRRRKVPEVKQTN